MNESFLAKIDTYLQNPNDYELGVYLYGKFARNRHMLARFTRSETKYNREKVIYLLSKYLKSEGYERKEQIKHERPETRANEATRNQTSSKPLRNPNRSNHATKVCKDSDDHDHYILNNDRDSDLDASQDLIDTISRKRDELAHKYKNRSFWHSKLEMARSNTERFELAKSIIEIQPEIEKDLDLIEWMETNQKMHPSILKKTQTAEDLRNLNNA